MIQTKFSQYSLADTYITVAIYETDQMCAVIDSVDCELNWTMNVYSDKHRYDSRIYTGLHNDFFEALDIANKLMS